VNPHAPKLGKARQGAFGTYDNLPPHRQESSAAGAALRVNFFDKNGGESTQTAADRKMARRL